MDVPTAIGLLWAIWPKENAPGFDLSPFHAQSGSGLRRNDLELLLDFEAAHTWHEDINDRESHSIADNVREKNERLTKQLCLQVDRREQAIERLQYRRAVVDEADYAGGGREDSTWVNDHFYFSPDQKTVRAVIEIRNPNANSRFASIRRTIRPI